MTRGLAAPCLGAEEGQNRGKREQSGKEKRRLQMALCISFSSRLLCLLMAQLLLFSGEVMTAAAAVRFGINYGQIANNLPKPPQVAALLQSLNVNRVKLYDADPRVLSAFANTGVEFVIAIGNEQMQNMTDQAAAQAWLAQHVQPFAAATRITCITVGNEVFATNDTGLMNNLLPAMRSIYQALRALGLGGRVNVSSAHSVNVLATSYPPSAGAFREDLMQYIRPLLNFHAESNSPFLINAYPFFAYKANPTSVPLQYALFEPNAGSRDPGSNLTYDNMLYAQVDAVYAAMAAAGHASDVAVKISETGWPSKGDEDEPGASVANAAAYNGNLMRRVAMGQGTPRRPDVPVDVFVFALFNEDQKPGPTSERNYGLFYPDGRPVYDIGLSSQGRGSSDFPSLSSTPSLTSSSSKLTISFWMGVVVLLAALFL